MCRNMNAGKVLHKIISWNDELSDEEEMFATDIGDKEESGTMV